MSDATLSDMQPYRIELWQGMEKVVELHLAPDSSGKVAARLFFANDADQQSAVLVFCYLPYILLDMRSSRSMAWILLDELAADLREEAIRLLDQLHPNFGF